MKKFHFILLMLSLRSIAYSQTDTAKEETIHTMVEKMPPFPGGEAEMKKFIQQNVIFPQKEKEKGTGMGDTCYVTFIVEKDGGITNAAILKGVPNGLGFDQEALRVVSIMPKWNPGNQNGQEVRVRVNLPIKFTYVVPFISNEEKKKSSTKKFDLHVKCKLKDKDTGGIKVSLFEVNADERKLINTISYTEKFKESFEYQKDYILRFEREGYITKELQVSTKDISVIRWNQDFAVFSMTISLSKQTGDSLIVIPSGKIAYSHEFGDFDYQTK